MVEAAEGNISMQMEDMKGAIEQIRDKDMEVSTDDGFYSDDEEEEEDKGILSYEQVEGLGMGEEEKQFVHKQAALKAAEQGQLSEKQVQALVDQREEEYKETQWAFAEAQRGLLETGSHMAVQDFVTEAQGVADTLTRESLEKRFKEVQDQMC